VVGIFMNQILQGKPMTIFGDGSQTRAFSYVGDIVPVMADAIQTPAAYNQVFNIGADRSYTVNELAHEVARSMGQEANITYLEARNEVLNAYSAHDKVEAVFGKRRLHSLEEGLHRMASWVQQHGARESQPFQNIEIRKNLPPAWQR
jgi:UDP-glucose 4-epimerase